MTTQRLFVNRWISERWTYRAFESLITLDALYNQEISDVYKVGKKLSELFEERFSKIEEQSRIVEGDWCLVPEAERYPLSPSFEA